MNRSGREAGDGVRRRQRERASERESINPPEGLKGNLSSS